MSPITSFPSFDIAFMELDQFIWTLIKEYKNSRIKDWDSLDSKVKSFFTDERMDSLDAKVRDWKLMSSYSDGVTLTHVICVFLGLYMLTEFQVMSFEQQQMAKWIVLFHDIEKDFSKSKRDSIHMVKSAVNAANILPGLGFPITSLHQMLIHSWSENTLQAVKYSDELGRLIPDNSKLPEIVEGINKMFSENTPASLIVKGVLFHQAVVVVKDWPQPAPLTNEEINLYISKELFPLIKVMHLADNDGWPLSAPAASTRSCRWPAVNPLPAGYFA